MNTVRIEHVLNMRFFWFVQAWPLEVLDDTGYALLSGPDEEIESAWASDLLDVRIFANAAGARSLWLKDDTPMGLLNDINKSHQLVEIMAVRGHCGDPGTTLDAAVFTNPKMAGHIWWMTDSIYDKLNLTSSKNAADGSRKGKPRFVRRLPTLNLVSRCFNRVCVCGELYITNNNYYI